jgi:DNA-binding NarL/FixJ family response regulator
MTLLPEHISVTRILIAAADRALCGALKLILRTRCTVELVGEASNRNEMRMYTAALKPDLVVLDWALPDLDGALDLASYRATYPGSHVVALSVHAEEAPAILAAGAEGFVHKGDAPELLIGVIQQLVHL